MTESDLEVTQLVQGVSAEAATALVLALARIGPLFLFAPLFSSRMMPPQVRGVCALALAVGIAPIAARGQTMPTEDVALVGMIGKEMIVGLAFAFVLSVLHWAVTAAGSLLDVISGFAYASVIDPLTGNNSAILSQAYALVGTMVFLTIGGDQIVIAGLARTYDLVPLSEAPQLDGMIEGIGVAFAGLMASAIQVCAPVLLALILTDAAFGLVSRVVPQMNVFAVGFPAKIVVAFLVIGASLPFVSQFISGELEASVSDALRTVGAG